VADFDAAIDDDIAMTSFAWCSRRVIVLSSEARVALTLRLLEVTAREMRARFLCVNSSKRNVSATRASRRVRMTRREHQAKESSPMSSSIAASKSATAASCGL